MPNVSITAYAYEKMRHYVDGCVGEVSGMGKVERDEDGTLRITDCTIFEQTVSGAHSDIDTASLAKFQVELIQKGEDVGQWRVWWHSHANMSVFWSITDTDTIDKSTEFEYLVSVVTNHARDIKCRVDVFKPFRMHADVTLEIEEEYNAELKAQCDDEIKRKVKEAHRTTPGYRYPASTQSTSTTISPRHDIDDREDDEVYQYYLNKGKTKKQPPLLPHSEVIDDETNDNTAITDAIIDEYYDELEVLQTELVDAYTTGDESLIAIADEMLRDHLKKGEQLEIPVTNTLS